MLKRKNLELIGFFSLGLAAFLFMYPYFTWGRTFVFTSLSYILLFLSLAIQISTTRKIVLSLPFLFIVLYIIYIALVGYNYSGTVLDSVLTASIFLPLFTSSFKYNSFIWFSKILSAVCVVSLLAYGLRFLGVLEIGEEILAPDGRIYRTYFANVLQSQELLNPMLRSTGFYRFYAVLNEPGFIGTIAALVLCAFQFKLKKHKFLYPLLATVLLSFSLAAYATVALYFVLSTSPLNVMKYGFPILLIVSVVFYDMFEKRIVERISVTESGLQGDNRTNQAFDLAYDRFLSSEDIWFGMGKGAHANLGESGGVSSWKSIVFNSGLFGLIIYLGIVLAIFFEQKNVSKSSFLLLLVFILTIYHRPNIHNIFYLLIFYGGLLFDKYEKKSNSSAATSTGI